MNRYVQKLEITEIKTEVLDNCFECNQVVKINENLSNIKILHQNISLNKNFTEFLCYLAEFYYQPECIILRKTWNINHESLFNIPGYTKFYNHGRYNQNDGVIIYILVNIKHEHKQITLPDDISISLPNLEINETKVKLLSVCRSPESCRI